jgi:hypothetical protein
MAKVFISYRRSDSYQPPRLQHKGQRREGNNSRLGKLETVSIEHGHGSNWRRGHRTEPSSRLDLCHKLTN